MFGAKFKNDKRIIEEGSSKELIEKGYSSFNIVDTYEGAEYRTKKEEERELRREFYNDITDYDSERAHEIDRRVFQEMHHKEPGEMLDQMKKQKTYTEDIEYIKLCFEQIKQLELITPDYTELKASAMPWSVTLNKETKKMKVYYHHNANILICTYDINRKKFIGVLPILPVEIMTQLKKSIKKIIDQQ